MAAYTEWKPALALRPFIDAFWLSESGHTPSTTRILPDEPIELRIQRAVDLIVRQHGNVQLIDLLSVSCLSVRQFERLFRQHTGVSAKTMCMVVRIHAPQSDG